MQLNKIKLSGFKSFVDPTTVLLPSHLVAVVGPNGCGKSNIIDAIQWVMGESSAKQLRGELLTDVIFNGSGNRKPVGQASVELVFDNQDGSLGGEYSNYAEISIKRVITRNSDSSYYLNGARCRRKDIIDIFLGTGLGPRSYSIIGQNMISRLIEAKPEDMRVYLEEAAGISKYKERRRETENRIHHAKENVLRLDDLRAELEKQLTTLKRQASAAERFKALKEEERIIKGQLYAILWRQLDTRLVQYSLQIQQQETGLEAKITEISAIDQNLEAQRDNQHTATEEFHEAQRKYYVSGNEINRLEQDIRHHQEKQSQWQHDLDTVDKEWRDVVEQLEDIDQQLKELEQDLVALTPENTQAQAAVKLAQTELNQIEEASQIWQTNWDEFNQYNSKTTQAAQVEQTKIQHLEQRIQALKTRQEKVAIESTSLNSDELENSINELGMQLEAAQELADQHHHDLQSSKDAIKSLHNQQQAIIQNLNKTRSQLQQALGQEASLAALQRTALGQKNNQLIDWLKTHKLDHHLRLAQHIEVLSGWEPAVEKVLGAYLQAICVDDLADVAPHLTSLSCAQLTVFSAQKNTQVTKHTQPNILLNKIQSQLPLEALLGDIYTAETLEEALALSKTLQAHESVVTPEGIWLGQSWLQLNAKDDAAAGIFQREQELKKLEAQITDLTQQQKILEESLENIKEDLASKEMEKDEAQNLFNQAHAKTIEITTKDRMLQAQLKDLQARSERLSTEAKDCVQQLELANQALVQAKDTWQNAMNDLEQQTHKRETMLAERETSREKLQASREKVSATKDHASGLQIRLSTTLTEVGALKQTADRMQHQLSSLAKRKTQLQHDLSQCVSVENLEQALNLGLQKRLEMEAALNAAREKMETFDHAIKTLEARRQNVEREMSKVRDVLETLRIESQSIKTKIENILVQNEALGAVMEEILQTLPKEATPEDSQSQLDAITQRITRLGAINLVAIEEYNTCFERKEYLDRQYEDLQSGLQTLEEAIAKIDKETRARFKETFDKVNHRFQELFPAIFGGGRAYLELTGENLLDAGITVMACPPGKRNSTIHLLSGGEKALTAISLVFSIFHLNPAPFCLLDEVDAPLDDANIGRFCKLVKNMSEKTQFIFISHNKLAIEMGKHLIGVTMHEPGVSRLVSVNLEEAIHLAGA